MFNERLFNHIHLTRCKDGYYGRPTDGQICKECMCPGGQFGNQFGSTCYFDERIDGVICNCQEGYVGKKLTLFFII